MHKNKKIKVGKVKFLARKFSVFYTPTCCMRYRMTGSLRTGSYLLLPLRRQRHLTKARGSPLRWKTQKNLPVVP